MPFRERDVAATRAFVAVAIVFGKAYAPAIAHRTSIRLRLWIRLDARLSSRPGRLACGSADRRLLFSLLDFKINFCLFAFADDHVLEHVVPNQSVLTIILGLIKF